MSIALIRDICAAPVNIYTITTNCSSPKKQNSKKKKKNQNKTKARSEKNKKKKKKTIIEK